MFRLENASTVDRSEAIYDIFKFADTLVQTKRNRTQFRKTLSSEVKQALIVAGYRYQDFTRTLERAYQLSADTFFGVKTGATIDWDGQGVTPEQ